ncbi:RTA1 like protein-domain-containing protein [Penicillium angulare]|uniref:RTA1 like protein-domain-containing protein n=1 Tax=Penicillium angulare TaxID=116970 RepID=UPI002540FFA9|nr:RTA1 like protein-domain-containing protein [Penicillium angulare]KAJ5261084.1 RTA1 like protein-domain-containing protein [Penicillium angulare]
MIFELPAPTFVTAGIYVILGRFIEFAGVRSLLTPKQYLWVFCTCDVISLLVQAVGGGMASVAVSETNGDTKPGTNIMVTGIIFQMLSITVFVACAADFLRRMVRQNLLHLLTKEMRWLLIATTASVVLIYIRSIYRTIELLQGWTGYLITHQSYFVALDGGMIAPAVIVFNIFHPSSSFTHGRPEKPYKGGELRNSMMEGPYIEMR